MMRAVIVALVIVFSAIAPATAAPVNSPVNKAEIDPIRTLQMETSLPVRQIKRVVAPIADFPSDHVHMMRLPPSGLVDFVTTHENKAHAFIRIFIGK
jgi:hypothetical protein